MAANSKRFVKAKAVSAKVHLAKSQGAGKKEIELVITIPEGVARNLARRLQSRFPNTAAIKK